MLGIGVILTSPVYPMLFYGQEMLTYASFQFPVPPPLDWSLASANSGIVQEVRDLISLRLNKNGNTAGLSGNVTRVLMVSDDSTDKVVIYLRSNHNGSDVLVIMNMYQKQYSAYQLSGIPNGTWKVRFNGDSKKYSSQNGGYASGQTQIHISSGSGVVQIPAYSILILSQ